MRYILVKDKKTTADSVYGQLKSGKRQTWCKLAKKYAKDASGQNCGKATFSKGQTVRCSTRSRSRQPTNVVHAPFYDPTQYKSWFVIEPIGAVKKASVTDREERREPDQAAAAADQEEPDDDRLGLAVSRRPSAPARRSSTRPGTSPALIRARRRRRPRRASRRTRRAPGADRAAAPRVPVGSRADRAHDRRRTRSRRHTRSPTLRSPDDDAKLLDEVGDLLFQSYFLALLLEERDAGSLEQAAAACTRSSSRAIRTCSATPRRAPPAASASAGRS